MHGDRLVVVVLDEPLHPARLWKCDLNTHQIGKDQRDQANSHRGDPVLNGNHLVVLTENVLPNPSLRMVKRHGFLIRNFSCCHQCSSTKMLELRCSIVILTSPGGSAQELPSPRLRKHRESLQIRILPRALRSARQSIRQCTPHRQ